ncbi:MAG: hypothetical protein AAB787_01745 [Patescibacteria group bacterium]
MKKCIAVLTIAIFALMIMAEPLWALTTWSNPGANPTTIPSGKAVMLFKGLSEIQKLKVAYAIATTESHPTSLLPGEQFTEMTEGNSGIKSFVCVGGIDTLRGQCWVVDNIEVVQFVACNNLAWRQYCPPPPPPSPKELPIAPTPPHQQALDRIGKIPAYAMPFVAVLGGPIILGAWLFENIFGT